MERQTTIASYHVFTHGEDEWFDEYNKANDVFKEWAESYGSARLYQETYIGDESNSEECLKTVGEFPW